MLLPSVFVFHHDELARLAVTYDLHLSAMAVAIARSPAPFFLVRSGLHANRPPSVKKCLARQAAYALMRQPSVR
jgi:hypothetical protein